jgi:hypothetical protein
MPNTFTTPQWVKVEASRLYLRSFPALTPLVNTLSDDQVVEVAHAVARELAPEPGADD